MYKPFIVEFPYICHYLNCIKEQQYRSKIPIIKTLTNIEEWLSENVNRGGENNYSWAEETSAIIDLFDSTYKWCNVPLYILFKYEIDLLAFRLRWSIV